MERVQTMTPEERESRHLSTGSQPPWLRLPQGGVTPMPYHGNSGLPLCICALWSWNKLKGTEEERQVQVLEVGS